MRIVMESRRWGYFPHRFRVMGVPVAVLSINSYNEIIVDGELRKYYGVTCAVFGEALLYCDESNTVWTLVRQRSNTACSRPRAARKNSSKRQLARGG